jgi:hypothetical protein
MANTITILSDKTYLEILKLSSLELLANDNIIFTNFIKENIISIKRGDLVNIIPKDEFNINCKWSDYLSEGFTYIVDKKDQTYFLNNINIDMNTFCVSLPKTFVLYEEPDYFTKNHWNIEGECLFSLSNYILWIRNNNQIINNLVFNEEEKIITTWYEDCRRNCHKIIYKLKENCIDEFEKIILKDIFYIVRDFENGDDKLLLN